MVEDPNTEMLPYNSGAFGSRTLMKVHAMHRITHYPRAVKVAIAKDGICNLYRLHADWEGVADKLSLACMRQWQPHLR